MERRKIFFNEELHKYTDEYSNVYVSTTTYIKKYHANFEEKQEEIARHCERAGRNPRHEKYAKYKGRTAAQLLALWKQAGDHGRTRGNVKHNYLEQQVKSVNGYNRVAGDYINDLIYTIPDILDNHSFGLINPDILLTLDLKQLYPPIYSLIEGLVASGYRLYAEIGTYNPLTLISGLIDLLAVKDNDFLIIDWKTNKAPIKFESGYWEKDRDGELLDVFKSTEEFFYYPVAHLVDSQGNRYAAQLSTYAELTANFSLNHKGTILCQIRDTKSDGEVVELIPMPNLRTEVVAMMDHFHSNRVLNSQTNIFMV